jgi:hypothetical protein
VPGALDVGARAPVARDPAVDDPRVHLPHPLVADAEALQHAGAEAVEHDVVALDEAEQGLLPLLVLEVQPDRPLAPVERKVERRAGSQPLLLLVAVERRGPADVVAHAGVLDLQHLGAEVGEQQAAEAAGQEPGQVEDPDVGEGEVAHRALPSARRATPASRLRRIRPLPGRTTSQYRRNRRSAASSVAAIRVRVVTVVGTSPASRKSKPILTQPPGSKARKAAGS